MTLKIKKIMMGLSTGILALIIAGCSSDEPVQNNGSTEDGQTGQSIDTHASSSNELELDDNGESGVGFELDEDGEVQEASNVPADVENAVFEVFNHYIDTFNREDLDGYMSTLSENPSNFTLEEEREAVAEVFETFDVNREVELQTIIDYGDDTAQVYADLVVTTIDPSTKTEITRSGRQITLFKLEDEEWKIDSIFFMAEE
ncbi:hypothetical protein [Jeotgalibacillus soli]|uniref:DUF4440 domain-containing protein n=1 Tax=Jeotgalibacillus soli TaxID=889306 RepID=A0A0C2W192_9BACL|nr:hypothetical protein [Jeotgalibacillus soli]KIL49903.1 hypothetical protein KP78_13710 [Jeotgalibacillus soli]